MTAFNKLLYYNTKFKRVFLKIPLSSDSKINMKVISTFNLSEIILPVFQASVIFCTPGDIILVDDEKDIENLCYLDYQLISEKDYKKQFKAFCLLVNLTLQEKQIFQLKLGNKILYKDFILIGTEEI
jgi:hypothetical protein